MIDYKTALAEAKARGTLPAMLASNTYLVEGKGYLAIKLYDTEIVKYYPNKIVLNSGGFRTGITKDRIIRYTGFNLWTYQGNWLVGQEGDIGNSIPFADGMYLDTTRNKWYKTGELQTPQQLAARAAAPVKKPRKSPRIRMF